MLTRKLHKAFQESDRLAKFLVKRGWDRADELTTIIDRANDEIEKIADEAILEVLRELNGRYLEEAKTWARNEMTDANGKPVLTTKAVQRKAQTDANKISSAIRKLRDMR